MAEESENQERSTEDQGTSPWTNDHLTMGLQGGPKCTVDHVLGVPYGYQLGLPRTSAKGIPAVGSPESLLSTLTLFYLVSISRHAREEARVSHHSQVPQDECNICQDYYEGGGCNTTSLVHWEKFIKHRRGKVCWELMDWHPCHYF